MKHLLTRLALIVFVLLLGVGIGRRTEVPMRQQSAAMCTDSCHCDPGPGIQVVDSRGRMRWADTVCNCWGER